MAAVALATLLTACDVRTPAPREPSVPATSGGPTSASPSTIETLKVAYVQDLAPEQALDTTLPPLQAVELAFATAADSGRLAVPVEVVPFDTQGDPTVADEVAEEIASDPSFVAAVAAPNLGGLRGLVETLGPAGVSLLSLSGRDSVEGAEPGTWFRFVAPLRIQASSLADGVSRLRSAEGGVCLAAAPPDGTRFLRSVRREMSRRLPVTQATDAAGVAAADCRIMVWTGNGPGGAAFALELRDAGVSGTMLVGGPGLREPDFLSEAGSAAEGAVSFCSCADVSTSLGLGAQRFIQDYQSEFGAPPGPYAVEAWDAAHMLIRALQATGTSREGLLEGLAAGPRFEGLGGRYVFAGGELAEPAAAVRVYRLEGGRWAFADRVKDRSGA